MGDFRGDMLAVADKLVEELRGPERELTERVARTRQEFKANLDAAVGRKEFDEAKRINERCDRAENEAIDGWLRNLHSALLPRHLEAFKVVADRHLSSIAATVKSS